MFSVNEPEGFAVEDTDDNMGQDGSDLENSSASEVCGGQAMGEAGEKEENVTEDGKK